MKTYNDYYDDSMRMDDIEKAQSFELQQFSPLNEKSEERVNHPDHYNPGTYEAINVIEAYELNFNLGNSIKYILRAGRKKSDKLSNKEKQIEDLKKAACYVIK